MSDGANKLTWADRQYWQARFLGGDTPWELGTPSSVLVEALQELEQHSGVAVRGSRVLSPGCGTASDGFELARRGAHVIGVDWSEFALSDARRRYDSLRSVLAGSIEFRHGDFFGMPSEPVDLVCEHTFFCAIDPAMRPRYIDTVALWIKPGGFLVGNFFVLDAGEARSLPGLSLTKEGVGPPFASTCEELENLMQPYFSLVAMHPAQYPEPTRRPGMEWVGIFRRVNPHIS